MFAHQVLKRHPESSTEELEDTAQDDVDADVQMLGALSKELAITGGIEEGVEQS